MRRAEYVSNEQESKNEWLDFFCVRDEMSVMRKAW